MTRIQLDPTAFVPLQARAPGGPSRAPATVRHTLADDGLLSLPRLAELAASLPDRSVEHNLGSVPDLLPDGVAPQVALTPREIVETIGTNGCWIVLKNIEQDPHYAALLDACLDDVEPYVTAAEGRSVLREGFVFLSAPGSMTPAHIDPEHNVLLQLRGTKTVSVGRFADEHARTLQVEQLHSGGHRNLREPAVDLLELPLGPGDGVYVPVHAPHLVRNGPTPSISLSVTWGTRTTLRDGRVHGWNARRRARGAAATGPGASVPRDEAKALALRVLSRLGR